MLGGAVRGLWIAALAGAVVVAFAACGGDDDEESTGTTATSSASAPSTSTTDPSAEVEAAYLAYWDAYLKASSEPVKPDLPELQALMTGDHQRAVARNLRNLQGSGRAVRERENSRYRNVFERADFADEAEASFSACSYDDLVTYDVGTGEPVDDSVATKWLEGQMVREGAAWKVARLEIVRREPGRDQCPR
ncbi:MAG TPA: hypothetical protein VKD21_13605 [Acidimicrobiales bacterium]|nr:hypothetical protein [Acidimicrobiales bacterium]